MTKQLCRLMFVVAVLILLVSWAYAMAAKSLPDIQGICTENLTVDGYAAGKVTIRTAIEADPGASASFRSDGWSPYLHFTGNVESIDRSETGSRVYVNVGRNVGTAWIPYYVYKTVSRWCDD